MADSSSNKTLIVFDLDYTVWPLYVECASPPFRAKRDGMASSGRGNISLYPQVLDVLNRISKKEEYVLAVASKSPAPQAARQLMDALGITRFFPPENIFIVPREKTHHFENLRKITGIPFTQMVFFDDEHPNIRTIGKLGVTAILVEDGVSLSVFENGMKQHTAQGGSRGFMASFLKRGKTDDPPKD